MPDRRSGCSATSSHVQNTHAIHEDSGRPANEDAATTLQGPESAFAAQTSQHDSHNSSTNAEHSLPRNTQVPPSNSASTCSSFGLTDEAANMHETLTALRQLAQMIARDPGPALSQLRSLSQILHSVSIDPPVTEKTLRELNLERICFDARLRHDLNFDSHVSFRPNYDGDRGRMKKELAQMYWAVLAVELGYFIRLASRLKAKDIEARLNAVGMTWRLRHMFTTIRGVLLTLVQQKDADSVRRVLDVDLLVQQLEHGVCDLVGLGEWLGTIIKSSCSPVRDAAVTNVVDRIRHSVLQADPCGLASTIEQLFSVLETMKLDVANHQIRGLRLKMISDTVQFSQDYFKTQKSSGVSFVDGAQWFSDRIRDHRRSASGARPHLGQLEVLSRGIVSLIQKQPVCQRRSICVPNTFAFDLHRFDAYGSSFDILRACAAISSTFERLRANLSQAIPGPASSRTKLGLIHRLITLDPGFHRTLCSLYYDDTLEFIHEDVLVEILRATYESIGKKSLSQVGEDTMGAYNILRDYLDNKTENGRQIDEKVGWKLEAEVLQEVDCMASMDELEMHNYCERDLEPHVGRGLAEMTTGRGDFRCTEQVSEHGGIAISGDGYRELARNIAHLTVLHWRIWGHVHYEPWLDRHPVHQLRKQADEEVLCQQETMGLATNEVRWLNQSREHIWEYEEELIDPEFDEWDEDEHPLSY